MTPPPIDPLDFVAWWRDADACPDFEPRMKPRWFLSYQQECVAGPDRDFWMAQGRRDHAAWDLLAAEPQPWRFRVLFEGECIYTGFLRRHEVRARVAAGKVRSVDVVFEHGEMTGPWEAGSAWPIEGLGWRGLPREDDDREPAARYVHTFGVRPRGPQFPAVRHTLWQRTHLPPPPSSLRRPRRSPGPRGAGGVRGPRAFRGLPHAGTVPSLVAVRARRRRPGRRGMSPRGQDGDMPERVEIYVACAHRDPEVAHEFLDHFLPVREPSAEEHSVPELATDPTHVFQTAAELMAHLHEADAEGYAIYWRRVGEGEPHQAMLVYTEDGGMIAGLVAPPSTQKALLVELASVVGGVFGTVTREERPPATITEFVARCRRHEGLRLVDGRLVGGSDLGEGEATMRAVDPLP